jgi:hypothetical protein
MVEPFYLYLASNPNAGSRSLRSLHTREYLTGLFHIDERVKTAKPVIEPLSVQRSWYRSESAFGTAWRSWVIHARNGTPDVTTLNIVKLRISNSHEVGLPHECQEN